MKNDIVFADKVDNPAVGRLPVFPPEFTVLRLFRPLPGKRDIAEHGIEPDVEHLSRSLRRICGQWNAPEEVAGYCPVRQPLVQPGS